MVFDILSFIVAFFTIISLVVIHEFGHFIIAKRRGVKVEEFGIGYPPRLFGKKFGDTLYSVNLLPFGAFVRILGEIGGLEDFHSFSGKKIWERILIVLGGVLAFWIVSIILLIIVFGLGMPTPVSDEANNLADAKVQITAIAPESPAAKAGLEPLDTILLLKSGEDQLAVDKAAPVVEFINNHKGQEVIITLQRWSKIFDVSVVPRVFHPEGEGSLGIGLVRVALLPVSWYKAPYLGVTAAGKLTLATFQAFGGVLGHIIEKKEVPSGVTLMGPLGIFNFLKQVFQLGINYFLYFVALISILMAIFNLLPIPALDGGKILFLAIEAVRRKAVSPKIEQNITATFFLLLIILSIFITIKFDIPRIF